MRKIAKGKSPAALVVSVPPHANYRHHHHQQCHHGNDNQFVILLLMLWLTIFLPANKSIIITTITIIFLVRRMKLQNVMEGQYVEGRYLISEPDIGKMSSSSSSLKCSLKFGNSWYHHFQLVVRNFTYIGINAFSGFSDAKLIQASWMQRRPWEWFSKEISNQN